MEHKDYTEVHPGTQVTRSILNNLGSPDDALKIIHIAGTNGKGSVAELFTQILIAAGKKVGTFTSPAVYDFYDQFRIDGQPIPAENIEKYFERALTASDGLNPTDFEIQTAGALLAFKEEGCEWAVVECGMGGLNDATNAINKKELAVITSISLEHTQYLGNTIEEICAQKAGIIKNCPAVVTYRQSVGALEYFKNIGVIFAGGNGDLRSCNAATAVAGAKILGLPEKAISEGVKNAKFAGRVEKFSAGGREYILDGAHNPAAFEPLMQSLKDLPSSEITVIFGCLKDKDIEGCFSWLSRVCSRIVAVECKSPRKMPLGDIVAASKKYFKIVTSAQSVTEALDKANTKTVVVCGSFTLLKEAKLWIDKRQ